jgi:hypothetical protein
VHQAYAAIALIALTIVLHSAGTATLIEWVKARLPTRHGRPRSHVGSTVLMVRLTSLIVCLHLLEILLWATFYRWKCFPAWEPALYFSAGSYSTVGTADLLEKAWRQLGPIESLMGVLMCALSASFLFAVVTRLVDAVGHQK